jgi:hypothetical protein
MGKMAKGPKEIPNIATLSLTEWQAAPGCKSCMNSIVH